MTLTKAVLEAAPGSFCSMLGPGWSDAKAVVTVAEGGEKVLTVEAMHVGQREHVTVKLDLVGPSPVQCVSRALGEALRQLRLRHHPAAAYVKC